MSRHQKLISAHARIIKMICFSYWVNENWLKTGKSEMYKKGLDYKLEEVIAILKNLMNYYLRKNF
jgi:hypothetical protein